MLDLEKFEKVNYTVSPLTILIFATSLDSAVKK